MQPAPLDRNGNGRNGDRPPVELTRREMEVLIGMSHGRSNSQIGADLFLSEDTVKTHARRLFRKLGARAAVALNPATPVISHFLGCACICFFADSKSCIKTPFYNLQTRTPALPSADGSYIPFTSINTGFLSISRVRSATDHSRYSRCATARMTAAAGFNSSTGISDTPYS